MGRRPCPPPGPGGRRGYVVLEQGTPLDEPHGRFALTDFPHLDAGRIPWTAADADPPASPATCLFVDLETTGLDGRWGALAFLVGTAFVDGTRLVVRQYLLEDPAAEAQMLREVRAHLDDYRGLVTYNGTTFDLPFLQARLDIHGLGEGFPPGHHLDLLKVARRRWRADLPSCRLRTVEEHLLGLGRLGDVEGRQIPGIYQRYLASGDRGLLRPILFHNHLDVKSMVALTILAAAPEAEYLVGGEVTAVSPADWSPGPGFPRAGRGGKRRGA